MTLRLWLPLAILLTLAGCQDVAAPLNEQNVADPRLGITSAAVSQPASFTRVHMLQQAPTAPPLETDRVSFWAYVGKASTVTVNYQPAAGQSLGEPFLRFDIPKHGLVAGAGGVPLNRGDSVAVTLTIDSVSFSVHFQPSGVLFSTKFPANLTIWYENANPDLNGDGVVDRKDQHLEQLLAIWYNAHPWSQLSSKNNTTQLSVSAALYHFSEYALCW